MARRRALGGSDELLMSGSSGVHRRGSIEEQPVHRGVRIRPRLRLLRQRTSERDPQEGGHS